MTTENINWNAVYVSCLASVKPELVDAVSLTNAFFYLITKKGRGYRRIESPGQRAEIDLMYEVGQFDFYDGYDPLPETVTDGVTKAFWDWRQGATPIMISGKEEKQNKGIAKRRDLLKTKVRQAKIGIREAFGRFLLQGQGAFDGTSITEPAVSPNTGRTFIDPLPRLIAIDPTLPMVVGGIDQSSTVNNRGQFWWRNKALVSQAQDVHTWFGELRHLYNDCKKGAGGAPNLHLCDQRTAELYEAALATLHENPSYQKADIPFDNISFKGKPLVWDEFVPDVVNNSTILESGSWFMINTDFWEVQVDADTDFAPTDFQKPANGDYKLSHLLWMGAALCANRAKQGVMGGIRYDLSLTPLPPQQP